MSEREDLIKKANELGLEFPSNVKTKTLQKLIENSSSKETVENNEEIVENTKNTETKNSKPLTFRQKIAERKKAAFKTRIVVITNKDTREANFATTAPLSFENNYFGLAKSPPLDTPVELEVALIEIAKKTLMTLHKSEIVNGVMTGNSIPVRTNKYSVNYVDK